MLSSADFNMRSEKKNCPVSYLTWRVSKAMSQGRRDSQEDAFGFWESSCERSVLAVVADGAGGHGGGADASAAAVAEAGRCWAEYSRTECAREFLVQWLGRAHEAVKGSLQRRTAGARTAAVALLARGDCAEWVHAGDCRLYHFRAGKLLKRTRDDSVVQVLFENGEITEEEMGLHPDQNRLLQAIGGDTPPKPRQGAARLKGGDMFLLCTDGFWEHLRLPELEQLAAVPQSLRCSMLDQAVALALERAGDTADNASAILIAFHQQEPPSEGVPKVLWLQLAIFTGIMITFWLLWNRIHSYGIGN